MTETSLPINSILESQENSPKDAASKEHPERSSIYYFEGDPMAIFLVENRLFKIHRHQFVRGSDIFGGMFASPAEEGGPDGITDEKPILLPGVTVKEFEALLDYFYLPPHLQKPNLKQYLDLLSISQRFFFDEILSFSRRQVRPMIGRIPVSQRITLGDKYGFDEWLVSAFEELLEREETLTVDEARLLGFERVTRYLRARDASCRDRLEAKKMGVFSQQPMRSSEASVKAHFSGPPKSAFEFFL